MYLLRGLHHRIHHRRIRHHHGHHRRLHNHLRRNLRHHSLPLHSPRRHHLQEMNTSIFVDFFYFEGESKIGRKFRVGRFEDPREVGQYLFSFKLWCFYLDLKSNIKSERNNEKNKGCFKKVSYVPMEKTKMNRTRN